MTTSSSMSSPAAPPNLAHTEFEREGIALKGGFLLPQTVGALNLELDILFSKPSVNGSLYSIHIRRGYREILMPAIAVRSVNLLELALDARDFLFEQCPALRERDFQLTNIEIFSEEDNPKPLFWHTDNRKGMYRAMVYLSGGLERSGAFQYMLGTHDRDYYVEHALSPRQIQDLAPRIRTFAAPTGTLLLFDPMGFHAKSTCIENRRTIMFEFQPEGSPYPKSNIFLASHNLSRQVIDNIRFFINGAPKEESGSDRLGLEAHFRAGAKPLPIVSAIKALAFSVRASLPREIRDLFSLLVAQRGL